MTTRSQATPAAPLAQMAQLAHEQVLFCQDEATGLKAIIAIHNSVLGPALGGLRFYPYADEAAALTDVLRLSRGMTYKSAAAGIHLGGGKAVILGDPNTRKSEALLRRFGQFVENLGGKYITAEDVGVNERDMTHIRRETRHVTGLPESYGGSGDPSPVTAYGVFLGIKAAWQLHAGTDSLTNKRVLVHGVGKVGSSLATQLHEAGAQVFVADVNPQAVDRLVREIGATAVALDAVASFACDIYAPCALGGSLNQDTIAQLQCAVVAGAANNQLLDELADSQRLLDRGILYAPDFVINAGGVINVFTELEGYHRQRALALTEGIYDQTLAILRSARDQGISPHQAALDLATRRIQAVAGLRQWR